MRVQYWLKTIASSKLVSCAYLQISIRARTGIVRVGEVFLDDGGLPIAVQENLILQIHRRRLLIMGDSYVKTGLVF